MADQPRWLSTFAMTFLYRYTFGSTYRNKNILKYLQAKFVHQDVPTVDWKVLTGVQLYSNDKLVGESFVDGTGWLSTNRMYYSVGMYQKKRMMNRLIRENMHVVSEELDADGENVLYFKHKPMSTKFAKSGRGFTDWVTSKYAAVQ